MNIGSTAGACPATSCDNIPGGNEMTTEDLNLTISGQLKIPLAEIRYVQAIRARAPADRT